MSKTPDPRLTFNSIAEEDEPDFQREVSPTWPRTKFTFEGKKDLTQIVEEEIDQDRTVTHDNIVEVSQIQLMDFVTDTPVRELNTSAKLKHDSLLLKQA